jgi:hypothetical protein
MPDASDLSLGELIAELITRVEREATTTAFNAGNRIGYDKGRHDGYDHGLEQGRSDAQFMALATVTATPQIAVDDNGISEEIAAVPVADLATLDSRYRTALIKGNIRTIGEIVAAEHRPRNFGYSASAALREVLGAYGVHLPEDHLLVIE